MQDFILLLAALVTCLTIHEASHALVAYYLGDSTPKLQGRISLNPLRHLDLVGSIVFLATMRIGWGKPVEINVRNFQNPLRDQALVALAGPMSNFLFALVLTLPLKYLGFHPEFAGLIPSIILDFLKLLFSVNVYLGIFNLLPFPPLDGSKILGLIIPRRFARQYEVFLDKGFGYFVAGILIDVLILRDFLGFSIIGSIVGFLYDRVNILLLLGT